uniref:Putative ovule protein n=1 Tax=Solanum chacoense TaxID=4108 RepID=A0A0V0HG06_SOLCH
MLQLPQYRVDNIWIPIFRTNLQDWEINEVLSLLHTLEECNLDEQTIDRLLWGNTKEGNYTVKESYKFLVFTEWHP